LCPLEYRAVRPLGAGWPLKTCIFRGFAAQKTISSYSFDRIVLIFDYIVERTNTKILSIHFFAIFILNPNYDVINDVISGFAKFVVGESCRRAMRIAPPAVNHRSVTASLTFANRASIF